ncbi:tripartite tricarboxylate transporter TctB family protein [Defluviimonas sp. WL0075]|uniref:Tripartite tricarboxylate transporter TctB family protein n=1 Tax=Albidovulum sediminicola TaxID=2984331 RepID=A0ABT2YXM4_9RHOB|nr:tripartite tricarboxylate transporter TctB family protein [Defluviimonas sp. WL0075]MCV2863266.1 tripartite tricarboxylate transporter TctB family protein [Defluviimonas sp. WL0075]
MIRTDRIFGVVVILVALAFIASAYNLPAGNMFDKLGPKVFPIIVGIGMAASAAAMIVRPDAEPDWPAMKSLAALVFATVVMIAYAYMLRPFGFLVPTAIVAAILSYQIDPKPARAALIGVGLSAGLYVVFKYALGLGLVALPRALMG